MPSRLTEVSYSQLIGATIFLWIYYCGCCFIKSYFLLGGFIGYLFMRPLKIKNIKSYTINSDAYVINLLDLNKIVGAICASDFSQPFRLV
jgi:hypothetical protein